VSESAPPPAGGSEHGAEEPANVDGDRQRRRGWLPLGALVFLGFAVALVLTFVLVRPDWFSFFGDDDGSAAVPPGLAFHKSLTDIGTVDGLRLSDDNTTSQTFTVPVPVDSRLGDAELTLRGHSQAAESSTVFLRVLADGVSVYVHELPSGDHDLSADIALPASATEDGSVTVQTRLTGGLDQQRCNLDEDVGALVVLDAGGTGIRGRLGTRLHTVRDVMAGLDHEVTLDLALPEGSKPWFETATRLGVALTQAGHDVSYADVTGGLSDNEGSHVLVGPPGALANLGWSAANDSGSSGGAPASLRVGDVGDGAHLGVVDPTTDVDAAFLTTSAVSTADAAGSAPRSLVPERRSGATVAMGPLGLDSAVQQVTNTRGWRATYSLADLPGGTPPTAVRLMLQVPVTSDDSRWLVQVEVNGQLAGSERLRGSDAAQEVRVAIPAGTELLRNDLTITLTRDRDLGGCNVRQTEYDVQILPSSRLVLGGTGAGFTRVPSTFADGFVVDLASSATERPAGTLTGLVPTLAEFSGWQQQPRFAWDAAPSQRPFLYVGEPPAEVDVPVRVSDDRLVAAGLDLQSFQNGLVVQCASVGSTRGLVLTPVGDPDAVIPAYGRQTARIVTTGGGGAVVTTTGRVVTDPPVRTEPAE
jgi:cellulose synthase operon protein B